ncbi:tRNA dimethylallyltransferase, mitochondrial [Drosophila serrata]|uniref:tRNA dimethylallyltransferase, mitochondrial n=1 Tax=Drosophila serrata TaxID=7274 RepID=UPI000A1D130C|nr:tRNA dimethylallyltransferase, mitochondrial [Drosophila serrata]
MMRKVPLIVILGSTGTGKTKLSLELAERFGGEIISADSMQVYTHLDIATAKATKEEQTRARHHLLDVTTPAEPFTVTRFRNAALPIIERLLAQAKPPIVVGGTNYYIESLLWDVLVDSQEKQSQGTSLAELKDGELDAMTTVELHKLLAKIDTGSANRIHPNNRRKILRAIEVYQGTGQTLTDKLAEQRGQPGGNRLGGPLRYPHTVLLWLRCNQEVLNARLDSRVDGMLEQGLIKELRLFHNTHQGITVQAYTSGVLQTIGYKEFVPYLMKYNHQQDDKIEEYLREHSYKLPSPEELKEKDGLPEGLQLLRNCCDELKLVTRRYSKKQLKWINNRFLASRDRQVPDLYELDTSDVSAWSQIVYQRAESIIECYRNGEICEIEPMAKREHPGADLDEETSHFCAICERHFVGEYQWGLHLKSNKHKRRNDGQRKRDQMKKEKKEDQGEQGEEEAKLPPSQGTETDKAL